MSEPSDISRLLARWSEGNPEALADLMPLVYGRLLKLARQRRRGEPAEASLNTSALVHEAYLRLAEGGEVTVRDRNQFLALASHVMRNLLVDHARARRAAKRGGGVTPLELTEATLLRDDQLDPIGDLDEALTRLEQLEPRQARMIEQRFFGGLSLEEVAAAAGVSLATVKRELRSARAWLAMELGDRSPGEPGHGSSALA
ncbi:MAG TPA: ECF-type sigma factor [Gemmatimonadales bacterium]|nr:ECF-type sigma factor [Gemmatimonadales bacterium]